MLEYENEGFLKDLWAMFGLQELGGGNGWQFLILTDNSWEQISQEKENNSQFLFLTAKTKPCTRVHSLIKSQDLNLIPNKFFLFKTK